MAEILRPRRLQPLTSSASRLRPSSKTRPEQVLQQRAPFYGKFRCSAPSAGGHRSHERRVARRTSIHELTAARTVSARTIQKPTSSTVCSRRPGRRVELADQKTLAGTLARLSVHHFVEVEVRLDAVLLLVVELVVRHLNVRVRAIARSYLTRPVL